MKLRVLVAEDNEVFRLGTTSLIATQSDLEVAGEARNGAEAISLYQQLLPDVVVVDLRMPVMDGTQVTAALCKLEPPARVLILTHYDGTEEVTDALRAGALGYLPKDSPGAELLAAIRAVAIGRHQLPSSIAGRLVDSLMQPVLTSRERQVLSCLSEGLSNREVAASLGIAHRSATTYVSQIIAKLNAKSRTEAVAIAHRRGLLRRS